MARRLSMKKENVEARKRYRANKKKTGRKKSRKKTGRKKGRKKTKRKGKTLYIRRK